VETGRGVPKARFARSPSGRFGEVSQPREFSVELTHHPSPDKALDQPREPSPDVDIGINIEACSLRRWVHPIPSSYSNSGARDIKLHEGVLCVSGYPAAHLDAAGGASQDLAKFCPDDTHGRPGDLVFGDVRLSPFRELGRFNETEYRLGLAADHQRPRDAH
jgi:hypothetical protein